MILLKWIVWENPSILSEELIMWISRKDYKFLLENAEKNINAECEILKAKDHYTRTSARVLEEYSTVLRERDDLRLRILDLENQLSVYKDNDANNISITSLINWLSWQKYANVDENSDAMTEQFEHDHRWELSKNCFINKIIKYLRDEASSRK